MGGVFFWGKSRSNVVFDVFRAGGRLEVSGEADSSLTGGVKPRGDGELPLREAATSELPVGPSHTFSGAHRSKRTAAEDGGEN